MYKVIHEFRDLQDNDYIYKVGDIYPFDNKEIPEERYQELSSEKNLIGRILIRLEESSDIDNSDESSDIDSSDESSDIDSSDESGDVDGSDEKIINTKIKGRKLKS